MVMASMGAGPVKETALIPQRNYEILELVHWPNQAS